MMSRKMEVGVLDGLRVVSSIIVMFHHIGALDEDLWDPIALSKVRGDTERNLAAKVEEAPEGFFNYIIGVGPGHVAVQVFLILAGFVSAHPVWVTMLNDMDEQGVVAGKMDHGSYMFKRYQKGLLRRFWRLALPIIPVQVTHTILYWFGLAYGPYLSFPEEELVKESYSVGIRAVWAGVLSGSLWIIETLFFAPFVSVAIQLPVLNLRPVARATWYMFCWAYFSGNFKDFEEINNNTAVVIGVALADLYNHVDHKSFETAYLYMAIPWLASATLVAFTWFPVPWYAHKYAMIASATGFVLLSLFGPWFFKRILDNRVMRFSGKFSYELYIWHLLILSAFAKSVAPTASKASLYIGGFTTCLVVAVVAYYVIEIPCNILTEWIVRWFMWRPTSMKENQERDDLEAQSNDASSTSTDTNDERRNELIQQDDFHGNNNNGVSLVIKTEFAEKGDENARNNANEGPASHGANATASSPVGFT